MKKPTIQEAEEAVKLLLRFAGEDPLREGLLDTPKRVIKSYGELYAGYALEPKDVLSTTFEEVGGYDEMIVLRDIEFTSHCEHHMLPFTGRAHIAYIPTSKVVGLSKLARLVDLYARRLQIQEKMTAEIAKSLTEVLNPKGVAVVIDATHMCMTMRGVRKPGSIMQTSHLTGLFKSDPRTRQEFFSLLKHGQ